MALRLAGLIGVGLAAVAVLSIVASGCSERARTQSVEPVSVPVRSDEPVATATEVRTHEAIIAEIARAASYLGAATFRAVYDFAGSAPAGNSTGTVVLAARPPSRLFSIEAATPGGSGKIITVDDGASNYLCTDMGAKVCMDAHLSGPAGSAIPPGLNVGAIVGRIAASNPSTVNDAPGQRIASRDGRCYRIEGADAGSGILCISPADGLLLLLDGIFGGGRITLRARDLSSSPADGDFVPPYPIVANGPE